jgi:hypothetical protein
MHQRFVLFCLLLALSQQAKAANIFYGIALLNQEVDISVSSAGGTLTTSDDASGIAVFADMYYQGRYRFNGTVSYVDYTSFYISSVTASADYLIPINASFTLFAGVSGGVTSQVHSDSGVADMAMSYLAGAQLGGIMVAGDHFMVELGYRQRVTDLETELTNIAAVATIDKISETYLSLNFIF